MCSVCRSGKFHKIKKKERKENRESSVSSEYHHCSSSVACKPRSGRPFPLGVLFCFVLTNKWNGLSISISSVTLSAISVWPPMSKPSSCLSQEQPTEGAASTQPLSFQAPPLEDPPFPGPPGRFQTKCPLGYVHCFLSVCCHLWSHGWPCRSHGAEFY